MLYIYNSLLKKKVPFHPITPKMVKMYVCGQTVYDYCHIGHARSMIIFDMIARYFQWRDFEVTYIRNITDIDDKIIQRAHDNKESVRALTARFIEAMHTDERALNLLPFAKEPRATEYIAEIVQLIQLLMNKGFAYITTSGDICFDVRQFKEYGKLSHRKIDDLMAGVRVEINEVKRDPLDFVLWKRAKPDEPKWSSPWGEGRPGWHIECSAMAGSLLGQPFDIHGGGLDLKFPHHENEIAQSEAALETTFANYWMHAGLLQVDNEKMSKSLGNFHTIRDVLKAHAPEVIRFFMLSAHYRSPLNYSKESLQQAKLGLTRLYTALHGLPLVAEKNTQDFINEFNKAMDDDFNTPEAYSVLFKMAHEINRLKEANQLEAAGELAPALKKLGGLFGFLQEDPLFFLQGESDAALIENIETLIAARQKARAESAWQEADRIRNQLLSMGIAIEDGPKGTSWKKMDNSR